MPPEIDIAVEAGDWPASEIVGALAARSVEAAFEAAKLACVPGSELSILLTDDAHMRAINRQWRGIDKPTNVLSFPGSDVAVGEVAGPVLGDIALAHETIAAEAELEGKPFDHHLSHMIVHGTLHLFGYDHIDDGDARVMEDLERVALARLGIGDPHAG